MQRLALLGCGRVSSRYIEVFKNELEGAEVSVVCDHDRSRAESTSKLLSSDVVYSKEELFNRNDIDAVLILTESGKHYRHAKQALENDHHVIVEKPAALAASHVLELQELAKRKNKMYACILQNRFNPAMIALKQAYRENRFGRLVLGTLRLRWCRFQEYYEDGWHGTWAMDGGVISQQALHHIDGLQWVCGQIDEVCCAQNNAVNDLEAEDTTVGIVKFSTGGLGVIEATTAARPEDFEASISVVGEKGTVVVGGIALNKLLLWKFITESSEDDDIINRVSEDVPTGYGLSHGRLLQEIVDRLNSGDINPPISGGDAVPAIEIIHALYRSVEESQWVPVDGRLSKRLGKNKDS